MQKKFLTTDEITHGYGIDGDTLQSLVDSGDLKALADRGTWKYRREDIEGLIKTGRLHPTKELPEVEDLELDESIGLSSDAAPSPAVDYLELDEDALSEQPTIIRGGSAADEDQPLGDHDSSSDVHVVFEPTATGMSDSDIRLGGAELLAGGLPGRLADESSDSDVTVAPDSLAESGAEPYPAAAPTEEISLSELDESDELDEGATRLDDGGVGSLETLAEIPTDWQEEEGAVFATPAEDSGLTLEPDSGITLETGDSGLTLERTDSGITLETGDSGITLDAGDSGISLDLGGDSGIALASQTAREPVDQLAATEGTMDFRLADEEAPPNDKTAVLLTPGSEEFSPTLSGAIAAGEEVEDLEVAPELDEVLAEDEEVVEAEFGEEEVLEADDEAFSEEFGATGEEEELAEAPGKAAARESGWGVAVLAMALSATLLVGANIWLAWEGLSTMWTGSETSAPAASLISTLAGLM